MFSKAEVSRIRSEFWTTFGQYMAPVPLSGSEALNWVNYKTGVKHIRFTMDFTKHKAEVRVEISFPEKNKRAIILQTFAALFKEAAMGEDWSFQESSDKDGKEIAAIHSLFSGVSIFQVETWPEAISFLKKQMIMLDAFWAENREGFEVIAG